METSRWRITTWAHRDLPQDLFLENNDLLILQEEKEGPDAYTYVWVNARGKLCWIENLPATGRAAGKEVQGWETPISFSDVNIVRSTTGPQEDETPGRSILTCTLQAMGLGTGEPGTVTVESNSPPPPTDPPGKP